MRHSAHFIPEPIVRQPSARPTLLSVDVQPRQQQPDRHVFPDQDEDRPLHKAFDDLGRPLHQGFDDLGRPLSEDERKRQVLHNQKIVTQLRCGLYGFVVFVVVAVLYIMLGPDLF